MPVFVEECSIWLADGGPRSLSQPTRCGCPRGAAWGRAVWRLDREGGHQEVPTFRPSRSPGIFYETLMHPATLSRSPHNVLHFPSCLHSIYLTSLRYVDYHTSVLINGKCAREEPDMFSKYRLQKTLPRIYYSLQGKGASSDTGIEKEKSAVQCWGTNPNQ